MHEVALCLTDQIAISAMLNYQPAVEGLGAIFKNPDECARAKFRPNGQRPRFRIHKEYPLLRAQRLKWSYQHSGRFSDLLDAQFVIQVASSELEHHPFHSLQTLLPKPWAVDRVG